MSHLFAWFSGFAASMALASALRLWVPMAISLGTVALCCGVLARKFYLMEVEAMCN